MRRTPIQRDAHSSWFNQFVFLHFQVKVKSFNIQEGEREKNTAEWAKVIRDVNLFLSDLLAWPLGKKKLRCVSTCYFFVLFFEFLINGFIHQLQFFLLKTPKVKKTKKKEKLCNARHRHPSPKRKAIQATRAPATGAARRSYYTGARSFFYL